MTDAVFIPDGDRFVPTKLAGSPWGDDRVHGGPPAGLLARAVERFNTEPDMFVSRLTVDLFRPVPMAPLEVSVRTVRAGRRIHVVEAALLADGVEVCGARGLLLRMTEAGGGQNGDAARPLPRGPEGLETSGITRGPRGEQRGRPGFHAAIEVRWVSAPNDPGPRTAWVRIPMPLVAGEPISPLARVAATSDFVNPFSGGGRRNGVASINVDSTIYLHRLPEEEWICLQVERDFQPYGLGVATAVLFDCHGPIGRTTQAALANRMT